MSSPSSLTADAARQLYVFAGLPGLAWCSTTPPTELLTAEIYGIGHIGMLVGLVFMSHQVGEALSSYLAAWRFDMTGSYTAMYLMGIALLIGARRVSYGIQDQRYSLKYLTPTTAF
jgi:hypothetical protein